jgi:hypothetical protein
MPQSMPVTGSGQFLGSAEGGRFFVPPRGQKRAAAGARLRSGQDGAVMVLRSPLSIRPQVMITAAAPLGAALGGASPLWRLSITPIG